MYQLRRETREHELKLIRLQEWENKINKVRRVKQFLLQKKEKDDKLRYVRKHIRNIYLSKLKIVFSSMICILYKRYVSAGYNTLGKVRVPSDLLTIAM